ncbi:MAG: carboxylesterase/lipase family protein [Clostridiales bacterium]|nr:carboxylesterase/lipase family protein [Clostridiales bacterium]
MKKILSLCLCIALCLSAFTFTLAEELPTDLVFTEIESGPIVGFTYKGVNTFRGVPYAQAKRFQAPEKCAPWTETRPSFNYGLVCPSGQNDPSVVNFADFLTPSGYHWIIGENCQNLNVWSPSMSTEEKLPVLVFMHGGGGNAQELEYYDGTNLAASGNIVFVSVNHRESMIGNLDLSAYGEQYKFSAFCEYLDIIASLEWVRDNIATFGGDPQNVTLMGQSMGSYNVQDLMGMPKAWGLYDKIVLNSGASMQSPLTATHADTQAEAAKVVDALDLTAETIDQINEIPYDTLSAAISTVNGWLPMPQDDEFFPTPVYVDGVEIEANKSIPMMVSTTYGEFSDNIGSMLMGYSYDTDYRSAVNDEQIMDSLKARYGVNTDKVIEMFQAAYPTHELFDALYINVGRSFGRDYEVVEMRGAKEDTAPIYSAVYCYNYPLFGGSVCQHTNGDLPYIFNNLEFIKYQLVGDEEMAQKVSDEAWKALVNFMRNGDPNGEGVPQWPAFDAINGSTMFFDRVSETRNYHLDDDLLDFMAQSRVE